MRKFAIILLLMPTFLIAQESVDTETQINIAADFAKSGLEEKAKTILVPLLHDGQDTLLNPRIRLLLGTICFQEKNYDCWSYHWTSLLYDYPNSEEASIVKEVQAIFSFSRYELAEHKYEALEFEIAHDISRRFWTYKPPDWKMSWKDVKDAKLALQYIDILMNRYTDPSKRAILLYDKFLIMIGCNDEKFGMKYSNNSYSRTKQSWFLEQCKAISDTLANMRGGELYYVKSQFLLGIMHSGEKFLSSKIKIKEEATIYFKNVLVATDGDITNPYRLFASIWLGEYYKDDKSFIDGKEN